MLTLELRKINVHFGPKHVLHDISARFYQGTVNSVIGINGVGKSVLMKSVAGMLPYSGQAILMDGEKHLSREHFAYVPQMANASSNLTAMEIVLLGKVKSLHWKVGKEELSEVERIMDTLHIAHLSSQPFSELSGGQKQMVTMAQALISKPRLLLLDEPTSALDLYHQLELLQVTKEYCSKNNSIALVVMHDLSLVSRFSDELLLLKEGRVLGQGTPDKILSRETLEDVYHVKIEVLKTPSGFTAVLPLEILSQEC